MDLTATSTEAHIEWDSAKLRHSLGGLRSGYCLPGGGVAATCVCVCVCACVYVCVCVLKRRDRVGVCCVFECRPNGNDAQLPRSLTV
jgi:hypothetical protein